ncbi:MAG: DUF1697 domain-containing protein [Chloroflexota bacterium]
MFQYIAFLRAINVGGRSVKMADLRDLFITLGFADIQTYIQSGNVLFTSPNPDPNKLAQNIEAGLSATLGYDVPTFLRTTTELIDIANYTPFPDDAKDEGTLYVSFLPQEPAAAQQQALLALATDTDSFHIYRDQVYWLYRRSLGASAYTNADVEKTLGMAATRRNINTIHKIVAKYLSV